MAADLSLLCPVSGMPRIIELFPADAALVCEIVRRFTVDDIATLEVDRGGLVAHFGGAPTAFNEATVLDALDTRFGPHENKFNAVKHALERSRHVLAKIGIGFELMTDDEWSRELLGVTCCGPQIAGIRFFLVSDRLKGSA